MAVTRMLTRVKDGLEVVFDTRSAPDDQIEFDASLEFVSVHSEDAEHQCKSQAVVNIWVALMCPEMGDGAKSTCQVMVPVQLLEEPEEVEEIANGLWDSLQSHRALSQMEADMDDLDDPSGDPS